MRKERIEDKEMEIECESAPEAVSVPMVQVSFSPKICMFGA